jgi:hypothetical protein
MRPWVTSPAPQKVVTLNRRLIIGLGQEPGVSCARKKTFKIIIIIIILEYILVKRNIYVR